MREEAQLCRTVQAADPVAQRDADILAEGCTDASATTGAQGSGTRLQKLLRQAGQLAAFQEEGTARQLPLSGPEANQARPSELAPVPAQARLAALPQQPQGARRGEERHRHSLVWPVVCEHPNRERG